jgi:hypothetical protein
MEGETIGSIYTSTFGNLEVKRGKYSDGKQTAIWIFDPLTDTTISYVTFPASEIDLDEGELLVKPRKLIRDMIPALLELGPLVDTGQRIRIDYVQMQIWKLA